MRTRTMTWAIIVMAAILIVSCSKDNPAESEKSVYDIQGDTGFIGTVEGTNAFVAILVFPTETVAYVCNGDEHILERFWKVINDPHVFEMTNSDGAQLSAQFNGDSFQGEVTLQNGSTHSFKAVTSEETDIGLYLVEDDQAEADGVEAGWIVNANGDIRGALRINAIFQTTPSLSTISLSIGSATYQVVHVVSNIEGGTGDDV